jgi:hypothetical protein
MLQCALHLVQCKTNQPSNQLTVSEDSKVLFENVKTLGFIQYPNRLTVNNIKTVLLALCVK